LLLTIDFIHLFAILDRVAFLGIIELLEKLTNSNRFWSMSLEGYTPKRCPSQTVGDPFSWGLWWLAPFKIEPGERLA
jgi:hypothetical protein